MDPLEAVFVFCFVFGVATSLISLALGSLHIGGGDAGGHAIGAAHDGGLHLGGDVGHAGGEDALVHDAHGELADNQGGVSPFNLQTITAFLAFFGGSGWVLYGSVGLAPALALVIATVVGIAGGSVVFWFLVKVLIASQRVLEPARWEGTVGRVTRSIRPEGTGEIVFSRDGARRSEGARSATGLAIEAGTEVVIVRYEGGLAYVEPWTSFAGES